MENEVVQDEGDIGGGLSFHDICVGDGEDVDVALGGLDVLDTILVDPKAMILLGKEMAVIVP